jgi:hypothetical protein
VQRSRPVTAEVGGSSPPRPRANRGRRKAEGWDDSVAVFGPHLDAQLLKRLLSLTRCAIEFLAVNCFGARELRNLARGDVDARTSAQIQLRVIHYRIRCLWL